jgi:hypothetical protein
MSDEIKSTAAAVTAALDALSPKPALPAATDASTASARLAMLTADEKWRDLYLAGGAAERREFAALTEMIAASDDKVGAILDGVEAAPLIAVTTGQDATPRALAAAAATLLDAGLTEAAIAQIIEGGKISQHERNLAEEFAARRHGDLEWRKRFLDGDREAQRESLLISALLSADVKEDAA